MGVDGAIDRLATWFAQQQNRQGILARRALGRPAPGDGALATHLIAAMRAEARHDGSVGGAALPTIWRVHEFLDLGQGPDQPGTVSAAAWVLSLQGKPGAFGEDCTPERHAHKVCEHFASGFFSPAPVSERVAPITMPTGKVFRTEPQARFAVSCVALRAVLRAGYASRPLVRQHVASLCRILGEFDKWSGYFAPDMMLAGIHAAAVAPGVDADVVEQPVRLIKRSQGNDGSWPNADLFGVLEALLAVNSSEAREAIQRAAAALMRLQRKDGSLGPGAGAERPLIGLRALLVARDAT